MSMDYQLAEQLRDAGFPQSGGGSPGKSPIRRSQKLAIYAQS